MKDKLKELLRTVPIGTTYPEYIEALADKLIAEGVIVPKVKIGDFLYDTSRQRLVDKCKVIGIEISQEGSTIYWVEHPLFENRSFFYEWNIGDGVYTTQSVAEAKLRELKGADDERRKAD